MAGTIQGTRGQGSGVRSHTRQTLTPLLVPTLLRGDQGTSGLGASSLPAGSGLAPVEPVADLGGADLQLYRRVLLRRAEPALLLRIDPPRPEHAIRFQGPVQVTLGLAELIPVEEP